MDIAPLIGAIGGGITLTGALILALVRYLTSDQPYRGAIAMQGEQIAQLGRSLEASRRIEQELRDEIRGLRHDLDAAADREEELIARVNELSKDLP